MWHEALKAGDSRAGLVEQVHPGAAVHAEMTDVSNGVVVGAGHRAAGMRERVWQIQLQCLWVNQPIVPREGHLSSRHQRTPNFFGKTLMLKPTVHS